MKRGHEQPGEEHDCGESNSVPEQLLAPIEVVELYVPFSGQALQPSSSRLIRSVINLIENTQMRQIMPLFHENGGAKGTSRHPVSFYAIARLVRGNDGKWNGLIISYEHPGQKMADKNGKLFQTEDARDHFVGKSNQMEDCLGGLISKHLHIVWEIVSDGGCTLDDGLALLFTTRNIPADEINLKSNGKIRRTRN